MRISRIERMLLLERSDGWARSPFLSGRAGIIETIAANCTPNIPELQGQTQAEKTLDDYLEVIVRFVGDVFFITYADPGTIDPLLPFESVETLPL